MNLPVIHFFSIFLPLSLLRADAFSSHCDCLVCDSFQVLISVVSEKPEAPYRLSSSLSCELYVLLEPRYPAIRLQGVT